MTAESITKIAKQKNILIVVLDAAGAKHFSCYGNSRLTTPNLDAVAREAVVFENAYSQASGTMLSVYSYFTSRYPYFDRNVVIDRETALHIPAEMTTMAEVMSQRYPQRFGYTCNTWLRREFGHDQGFTEYRHLWEHPAEELRAAGRRGPVDVVLIPVALDWMKAHASEGFFAYLHFLVPHSPYRAPDPYYSDFTIGRPSPQIGERKFLSSLEGTVPPDTLAYNIEAIYDASLAFIDNAIGGMIAELKAAGLWDDTIFVLMSDHGEAFWEHPPSQGHGGIAYEEAVRVPLVVRIPGVPELAGRRIAEPVELVDLLPTLMELQDIPNGELRLAGRSLVTLMADADTSQSFAPRPIYTQTNRRVPPIFAVIENGYKLLHNEGTGALELYNLKVDPAERFDLIPAGEHKAIADILFEKLAVMRERGGAHGTVAQTLSTNSLDEETRKRLRSLGYIR